MNKGLIIQDATIVTCDSQDCFIPCGDIYIKGKVIERIVKKNLETYDTGFLPQEHEYEVISAVGRIVMPGLINAHTHLSHSLMRAASDDQELFPWLENI